MADDRKPSADEEAAGSVRDIHANPASAALAAATEADKPRMFSPGMIKLWLIVGTQQGIDSNH